MSGLIPVRWPDVFPWARDYLPPLLAEAEIPDVFVRDEIPSVSGDEALALPHKWLILTEFPGATITAVTRYVRITMQAWVVKANGLADLDAARELAATAGFLLESAPHVGTPLNFAEIDSGPTRAKDSASNVEYQALTLLLEVGAL